MANSEKETPPSPQLTVVIGTLNRPLVVLSLIKQLEEASSTLPIEVFVVDQSLPENWENLEKQFPKTANFSLIHFERPNTCKYLNYGWNHARAPIVLYLDDDVTITDKTLKTHFDAYADTSIQGVAGRVINDGEQITKNAQVGKVIAYGAAFTKNFTYEEKTYVDFPYGCNMSFRKQALEEAGGFDEKLSPPIYAFNEVDLGYRISKMGKNALLFSPEALVYHHQYKRGGTRNDFEIKEVKRSNDFNYGYFLGKNFSWGENILCLLRRLPYQLVKEPLSIPAIINGFIYAKKR